jgi:putative ubiquitin-RnfH superfamily antitoxin RatB of RatAB toxin-antitoxin module
MFWCKPEIRAYPVIDTSIRPLLIDPTPIRRCNIGKKDRTQEYSAAHETP